MINICINCGQFRADKTIDPEGQYAICPECGYKHPFLISPLMVVSGASGAGKTTICCQLLGKVKDAILLDSDILWRAEFNQPESNYRDFFETWLRVAKDISQSGRPVVLFGAGLGVPSNIELCVERRYFSEIYYLALVCSEGTLEKRLQSRPEWRQSGNIKFIKANIGLNNWFKSQGSDQKSGIDLLDTTEISVQETADQVASWISKKLMNLRP